MRSFLPCYSDGMINFWECKAKIVLSEISLGGNKRALGLPHPLSVWTPRKCPRLTEVTGWIGFRRTLPGEWRGLGVIWK